MLFIHWKSERISKEEKPNKTNLSSKDAPIYYTSYNISQLSHNFDHQSSYKLCFSTISSFYIFQNYLWQHKSNLSSSYKLDLTYLLCNQNRVYLVSSFYLIILFHFKQLKCLQSNRRCRQHWQSNSRCKHR